MLEHCEHCNRCFEGRSEGSLMAHLRTHGVRKPRGEPREEFLADAFIRHEVLGEFALDKQDPRPCHHTTGTGVIVTHRRVH